jgi:PKD repeat protein
MSAGMRARFLVIVALLAAVGLGVPATASAAPGDYGHASISYSGVSNPPTSDKPQSKLWWNDNSWWADMWTTGSGWHIYRLDRPTESWVDTGILNDPRANSLADTLWDGTHLYIASHSVSVSTLDTVNPSVSGQPARLYRYSYSAGRYTLDSGFPTTITNNSSESMTIDKDSTGALFATWTQVAGNPATGYTNTVYVNVSAPGGTSWQAPFVIPAADPHPSTDDISSVVAFGANKVGVMWSDQLTGKVNWAVHADGTAPAAWSTITAASGPHLPDDHLNLKSLQADKTGRVFAVVKTSLDDLSSDPTQPQDLLLTYTPQTGTFTKTTISTVADCITRPQVLLDTQHNTVHVFHTAPATSDSSCAYSGVAGSIYEKTASMDSPVFTPGRGTPIIQDAASPNLNDLTTTKQPVNATSGLVVLASNDVTHRYWFADESLAAPIAPVTSFTATPVSGTVPVNTTFTDTSTGTPTSWSWDFGDGTPKASTQNPQHTYTNPGTYTVTLTATNTTGSNTITKPNLITTTAAPNPPSGITVRPSTSAVATTAAAAVTVTKPAGIATGDVLIAQLTANNTPTINAVPPGWTPVPNTALTVGTGVISTAYYHVVTNAGTEPATWSWTLSSAQRWGAGITAFTGVNTTTPFDTPVINTVDGSYANNFITLPGIQTLTPGDMLIGGLSGDTTGSGFTTTPPTGWTQNWISTGGKIAELASTTQPNPGPTGPTTWNFTVNRATAAWMTALKPTS